MSTMTGKLLVATPELFDPNFRRTVVLILEHDSDDGALGVVLNRPSTVDVADPLAAWDAVVSEPRVVFSGGPVSPEIGIALADTPGEPPDGWRPLVGNVGVVDLGSDPDDMGGALRSRVYSGYAGWSPGQLEAEIDEPAWFVIDPLPDDLFLDSPESLWPMVLARQPGVVSWYANYPEHPSLN